MEKQRRTVKSDLTSGVERKCIDSFSMSLESKEYLPDSIILLSGLVKQA